MHQFLIAIASALLLLSLPSHVAGQATGGERAPDLEPRLVVESDARVGRVPVSLGAARPEPSRRLAVPRDPGRRPVPAATWTADRAVRATAATTRRSGWRSVGRGLLIGAAAGAVSGLAVAAACDDYCDGTRARGVALHVGVGAVLGGVVGGLVHRMRE